MTTMTSPAVRVTGGVDTHRDLHVIADLDQIGGVLEYRDVRDDPGRVSGAAGTARYWLAARCVDSLSLARAASLRLCKPLCARGMRLAEGLWPLTGRRPYP